VRQRGWGWANSATQGSQTDCAGHVRQTRHWLAGGGNILENNPVNMQSIYSRLFSKCDMADQNLLSVDPQAVRRWHKRPVAVSAWLHEEVARRMQERPD
jgi:hypothetical protein